MFPTYSLLACLVIVEPTTGTAACGVSATIFAGICPAACIALYCNGLICSKPGGGTSQYNEGLLLLPLLFFGDLDRLLFLSCLSLLLLRLSLDLDLLLFLWSLSLSRDLDLRRLSLSRSLSRSFWSSPIAVMFFKKY
uniref:Putative secreted protein n=1 Tax=Panstrongylus lignarius TaxID=156445 RepID=A0A224XNQ1_9HEMI